MSPLLFVGGVLLTAFAMLVSAGMVAAAVRDLVNAVLALRHELSMRPVAVPKSDSLTQMPLLVRHGAGWRHVAYAEVRRVKSELAAD